MSSASPRGPSPEPPKKLAYSLKNLTWDPIHCFNQQNKYSYNGKGRKLGDAMLQCDMCEQWFHLKDVKCVPNSDFVPFQRNYRFSCSVCVQGPEQFELQTNTWTSIVLTACYNLLLNKDQTALMTNHWLKVSSIIEWMQKNWGSLATGRSLSQLVEGNTVENCLAFPQNASLFNMSEDQQQVLLRQTMQSKLHLRPLDSSPIPKDGLYKVPTAAQLKQQQKTDPPGGAVGGAGKAGNKRGRPGKAGKESKAQKGEEAEQRRVRQAAPSIEQIKLPEKYRLLPVPKSEMVLKGPEQVTPPTPRP